MKTLRTLPFFLAIVALPLVLSGCNKGGDMSATAPDTNTAPAAPAPAAPASAEAAPAATTPAADASAPAATNAAPATTTNSGT